MRKILITLLLASAAATPALAQRPDFSDHQQSREDRQQAREERQQAHEDRQQARQESRSERPSFTVRNSEAPQNHPQFVGNPNGGRDVRVQNFEGATVTTIEGLSADRSHPVQQAWPAEQATMCGYCEPGFIMAIAALLESTPSPSDEQIAALPNICRCGAYPRIRKAIQRAAQAAANLQR